MLWTLLLACSDYSIRDTPEAEPVSTVPRIELTPAVLDFGERSTQLHKQVTVKNVGGGRLRVDALLLDAPDVFTHEWQPPFPFEIGAGFSYSFPVAFTPAGPATHTGTLQLVTNAQNAEEASIVVQGTAILGDLVVEPLSWEMGAMVPGCVHTETFTLTNQGNDPITVSPPYIDGSDDWRLVSEEPEPFELGPDETREVEVELVVADHGPMTATLRAEAGADSIAVPMSYEPEWPVEQADSRIIPESPRINVLFAIDGSGSMRDEQEILALEFASFLGIFEGVGIDWRMGVVSADDGCFTNGVLSPETSNAIGQFAQAVRAIGEGGDLTEKLLALADRALSWARPGGCNDGFLGAGDLHLVFVSDEADQSPERWATYLARYQVAAGPQALVTAHGVVDYDGVCGQDTIGAAGYEDIVRATGGLLLDVCSDTWGESLVDIANQSIEDARSVDLTLPLVDAESLRVLYDGVEQAAGWSYEPARNLVLLDPIPVAGTEVRVEYWGAMNCR